MPEGGMPEDNISAVDENPIAIDTVESDGIFDVDDNLSSDNNVPPPSVKCLENSREESRSEAMISGSSCFRY